MPYIAQISTVIYEQNVYMNNVKAPILYFLLTNSDTMFVNCQYLYRTRNTNVQDWCHLKILLSLDVFINNSLIRVINY